MRKLLAISLMTLAPAVAAAETVASPAPVPSMAFSVFRMIGALCIVLSLLFTGVWFYKNNGRLGAGRGRAAKLKVIESRALGHRHSIFVVGYENQRILLSTSATGVTMLTHLPEATGEEETETAPTALPSFSNAFMQALASVRK
jgi:flagellar biogenesis protein FliO